MHFKSTWHPTNSAPSESLIMIQASALPDMSHVIAVTGKRLNCLVDIYISLKLIFTKIVKKSFQQNDGHLPFIPYCSK